MTDRPRAHPDAHKVVAQHAETIKLLGVDEAPVRRRVPPAPKPRPVEVFAKEEGPEVKRSSKQEGSQADRLEELRRTYELDAPHANFVTDFQNIVFGEGDPNARLMFVGEAPGAEEDKTGRPFVGRAGQLLDKMINAMGLAREQVYIANVLKTRPPNNQTPTIDEATACAPYLFEQIRIVAPEVIVTLGLPATRLLLDTSDAMGRMRGSWHVFPPPTAPLDDMPEIAVMPTYHPAFLLRSYTSENRSKVWSDLQQVMDKLGRSEQR
ncbi:MAG: uracil-DNA glycosylase [Phycisphaerae bacterium]|nr:uracil-DNA glycosylase [Phycisphaerae bacterium]